MRVDFPQALTRQEGPVFEAFFIGSKSEVESQLRCQRTRCHIVRPAEGGKEVVERGNKTGISVYILGLKDKKYLAKTYGKKLGKASHLGVDLLIALAMLRDLIVQRRIHAVNVWSLPLLFVAQVWVINTVVHPWR